MSLEAVLMALAFVLVVGAAAVVLCGAWWTVERLCWSCRSHLGDRLAWVDLRGRCCEDCRQVERRRWT